MSARLTYKSNRASRSAVFRENSKWWTKISYTRLTWVSRVKKVIQQFYWLYNWGQSCLATLVTPQNCTKMLRNLIFVVQFAYFSTRPKNFLFFRATFEQVSLQKVTFVFFLSNFLWNHGKLFGKSRATCVKPYQFHLLMQKITKKLYHRHRSRFRYQALCQPSRPFLQVNDSTFEPSFRYMCFSWFPFNFCFHIRQVLLQVASRL